MIEIKSTSNVALLSKALRVLGERQLPFAFALAATKVGQIVNKTLLDELGKSLDRPTPQTLKSLYLKAATKQKPTARVWFKDNFSSGIPADKYLQPQVMGGGRRPKRLEVALRAKGLLGGDEWAIPSKDILNQFGNMPGALAVRILSGLGAAETQAGVTANASGSRRSMKKGNKRRYFIAKIANTRAVWERKQTAFGSGIRPVIIFVKKTPTYRAAFPFFEISEQVVGDNYAREFLAAIDRAAATARPR